MDPLYACVECLRRSWLLSSLGHEIEVASAGVGWDGTRRLLRLPDRELMQLVAPGRETELLEQLGATDEGFFAETLGEAGCWAVCRHDGRFPSGVRSAADGPKALIGRGRESAIAELAPGEAVTVVGSRRATPYVRRTARDLGCELSTAGMVVVSGLAFGIDACAHHGALDGEGSTIAVLGCGPVVAYPAANRALWHRIVDQGAVVSELPPGSTPWRWSFPARSRVMAALAGMTVVVEAGERSGSLVTAELAAGLGRAVGAIPGPATSRTAAGSNRLLAEGARAVRDARDIFATMITIGGEAPATPV